MEKSAKKSFADALGRIKSRLHLARGKDIPSLRKELRLISSAHGIGGPDVHARLEALDNRLNRSIREREHRKNSLPKLSYPESLPICARRADIVRAIRSHQVVIITGETGSGKTTQIPKMCIEAGRGLDGAIGCTQPRRIAAVTVAGRIAEEMEEPLGRSVGYKIRFDERGGRDPWVKVMTDGIFLMELHSDPLLRRYDTIMIDEAHERSLNIDFSLGILRSLLPRRRDLKLVITSATLDSEKFSKAFGDAPILEVSGRLFPVEVRYETPESGPDSEDSYVEAAVKAVDGIVSESSRGDILIFMPTEQDINETCEILQGRKAYDVLPLYSRLSWADQRRIFSAGDRRKIVVATNIAETSITIPGIKYVIDTGLARISRYNTRSRSTSLPVADISRSSSDQRKGRCGRVQDGVCVRLYSREDYEGRPLFTPPEILRSNLAEVILKMVSLDLGDVPSFPFIDPPSPAGIKDGLALLQELGAIRPETAPDKNGFGLTEKGKKMSRLPIDPRLARVLIEAEKRGCLETAAIVAASIATQDPREWSAEKEAEARLAHAPFQNPASDFLGILDLWKLYHTKSIELKSRSQLRKFCRENFLSSRRMKEWIDVYTQLISILSDEGFREKSGERLTHTPRFIPADIVSGDFKPFYERLHKSVLSGFLSNIAVKKEKNFYTGARGKEIMLFPGSGLFNRGGNWIVCAEALETSRMFARTSANIESEWIEELGKHLCRYSYSEARWDRKRGEVTALEKVTLYGLTIVPSRRVSYGRINAPEASEIFIRGALLEGDMDGSFPFLDHNRSLLENFLRMEDKLRRRDIVAGEDALADFYRSKLAGVYDIRTLRRLVRDQGDSFLRMSEADVARYLPNPGELANYPDSFASGKGEVHISYSFRPGEKEDGATLKIPLDKIFAVEPEDPDWIVPGLMREKVAALLKGLPKELRKQLVPLPGSVEAVLECLAAAKGPFLTALGNCLSEKFGITVPSSAWQVRSLPDHLKMRFSIVDSQGRELAVGRDLEAVRNSLTAEAHSRALADARKAWEKKLHFIMRISEVSKKNILSTSYDCQAILSEHPSEISD